MDSYEKNYNPNITYIANSFVISYGKSSARGRIVPVPLEDVRDDGNNHWPDYSATDKRCRQGEEK